MSDHISQSHEDGNAASMQSYHSVWMAHWTPSTGCKSTNQVCNNLSISYDSGEESSQFKKRPLLYGPMTSTDVSKHDNGSGEVAGVSRDNPNIESLTKRSKKRRKERLDSEPFPMLSVSQHREDKLALNIEQATVSQGGALKFQTGSCSGNRTLSLDGEESQSPSLLALVPKRAKPQKEHIKSEGINGYPLEYEENSNKFLDNNTVTVSTFVRDGFMGSASKFIPYEMSSSKIPFTTYEQNIKNQSNSFLPFTTQVGNTNFHSYSTVFVQETKINQVFDSTRSAKSLSRQNMRAFLLQNPSSSNLEQSNIFPIQCDTRVNSSNTLPFLSQSHHPDGSPPDQLDRGGYPLSGVPYSVHDVEAMKVRNTMDSVKETQTGPSKFAQATHRFTISKKTDVREPTVSTNLKGKATSALLSSTNGIRDEKKHELLQLSGPIIGEMEYFRNMRNSTPCLSNESSSETDIMDMDAFHENHLTGGDASLADKELGDPKSALLSASMTDSARKEIVDWLPKKRLPDINESPPERSASASLMDNRESSTSKTHSLDVEHLLSNAEQPRLANSTTPLSTSAKQEMGNRWFKRLKPCDSDSVHDTKNSKLEEASSGGKANQLLNKMKCDLTSSEHSMGQLHRKEQLAISQTDTTAKESDSCSNISRKQREVLLSNPWIRRWCHNTQLHSKRLAADVVHKPEDSKPTLAKPCPSIAAMALMGKSVMEFHPCEFSRRGSALVWNTEGM